MHLEVIKNLDISINNNSSKIETKESSTQTDHINIQTDNDKTYLSNLLSNKERVLEQIGFIKNLTIHIM